MFFETPTSNLSSDITCLLLLGRCVVSLKTPSAKRDTLNGIPH